MQTANYLLLVVSGTLGLSCAYSAFDKGQHNSNVGGSTSTSNSTQTTSGGTTTGLNSTGVGGGSLAIGGNSSMGGIAAAGGTTTGAVSTSSSGGNLALGGATNVGGVSASTSAIGTLSSGGGMSPTGGTATTLSSATGGLGTMAIGGTSASSSGGIGGVGGTGTLVSGAPGGGSSATSTTGGATTTGGAQSSGGTTNTTSSVAATGGGCGVGQIPCSGVCKNYATDDNNCRACGHACGYGSTCASGLCSVATLHTDSVAITAFDVDDSNLFFSPAGIRTCPATTGCIVSPESVTTDVPGGVRFVANGFVVSKTVGASTDVYRVCPTTGCSTSNSCILASGMSGTNPIEMVTSSAHDFFVLKSNPSFRSLSNAVLPTSTTCSSTGVLSACPIGAGTCDTVDAGIASVAFDKSALLVANDAWVYFVASINGATPAVYTCPVGASSTCVPAAMSLPSAANTDPKLLAAHGSDLYFYQEVTSKSLYNVNKCPSTGCTASTTVAKPAGTISELQADSSGVYWIYQSSIQMCPLSGCVGAPVDVATAQGSPQMLRLNTDSVYWVNGTDKTIHRVTKPVVQ